MKILVTGEHRFASEADGLAMMLAGKMTIAEGSQSLILRGLLCCDPAR
jgi:hypothetical protein